MAEPEGIGSLNKDLLNSLANFIVRPPRMQYSEYDLGRNEFLLRGRPIRRRDLTVNNANGQVLVASLFEPLTAPHWPHGARDHGPLPCVVFCHGNSGSRLDADRLGPTILPYGIKMLAFDFSGSGLSDGDFISLGVNEKDDISAVVAFLKADNSVSNIAIHGQSMGAASAVMYTGSRPHPGVSCIALDSAYTSFADISKSLVNSIDFPVPVPKNVLLSVGMRILKKTVKEIAAVSLDDVKPIHYARSSTVPALFIHGTEDNVVSYSQAVDLHNAYAAAEKELLTHHGGNHHEVRTKDIRAREFCFLVQYLFPVDKYLTYFIVLKTRANDLLTGGRFEESLYFYTTGISVAEAQKPSSNTIDVDANPVSALLTPRRPLSLRRESARESATPPASPRTSERLLRRFAKKRSSFRGSNLETNRPTHIESGDPTVWDAVKPLLLSFYGNRSNAAWYLKRYQDALADADSAISLDPTWPRGYQRRASALVSLERPKEAALAVEEGLVANPDNAPLKEIASKLAHGA